MNILGICEIICKCTLTVDDCKTLIQTLVQKFNVNIDDTDLIVNRLIPVGPTHITITAEDLAERICQVTELSDGIFSYLKRYRQESYGGKSYDQRHSMLISPTYRSQTQQLQISQGQDQTQQYQAIQQKTTSLKTIHRMTTKYPPISTTIINIILSSDRIDIQD